MDAAEDLARLDDALRRSVAQRDKLVAARTIDAGETEEMPEHAADARQAVSASRRRSPRSVEGSSGEVFIDPFATAVAIDAGGREIADPFELGARASIVVMAVEHRIAGSHRAEPRSGDA